MYSAAALKQHPHVNPFQGQLNKRGQFMGIFHVRDGRGGLVRVIGPADASRWMPHQGLQEIARRLRQADQIEKNRLRVKISKNQAYGRFMEKNIRELADVVSVPRRLTMSEGVVSASQILGYGDSSSGVDGGERRYLIGLDFGGVDVSGLFVTSSGLNDNGLKSSSEDAGRLHKRVTWTSSNAAKTGLITHVVQAGQLPADVGAKVKDAKVVRDHTSFVVQADNGVTYWPRVSLLNFD